MKRPFRFGPGHQPVFLRFLQKPRDGALRIKTLPDLEPSVCSLESVWAPWIRGASDGIC